MRGSCGKLENVSYFKGVENAGGGDEEKANHQGNGAEGKGEQCAKILTKFGWKGERRCTARHRHSIRNNGFSRKPE